MDQEGGTARRDAGLLLLRLVAALLCVLGAGLGLYWSLETRAPGLISWTFLLILPAAISALVAYIADLRGDRQLGFYLMVPILILGAALLLSLILLGEGVICILMLAPLWLAGGLVGAWIAFKLRHSVDDGRKFCSVALLLPVLAMQIEPLVPLVEARVTVSREVVVDAPPELVWPLLLGIADVGRAEGRWNVSQDVIGVPRPLGARLVGEGVGAERLARWTAGIAFRERITEWQPGRRIGWTFIFDDMAAWRFTDPHLMPDSSYLRVVSGGYSLVPVSAGKTRVVLDTSYWMKTPLNAYSAAWGEFFLGDLENNLLAVIKARAEARPGQGWPTP